MLIMARNPRPTRDSSSPAPQPVAEVVPFNDEMLGDAEEPAFHPRERLVYSIKWGLFSVGTATLESLPMGEVDGQPARRYVMQVTTNGFADKFYKLRERMDSWVAEDFSRSLRYTKQAEGNEERDTEVWFDWEDEQVYYRNYDELREPLEVEPGPVFDPLGIMYAFRFAQGYSGEPGTAISMQSCDGKKLVEVDITVHERDTLKVPAGKFETVLVEPNTKDLGGVFKKSDDASIQIWYSEDARRIPVRLKSSVVVGSFTASLEEITTGDETTPNLVDFPDPEKRKDVKALAEVLDDSEATEPPAGEAAPPS